MTDAISQKQSSLTGIAALISAHDDKTSPLETTTSIFGEDGFNFRDIIDIINPLQHIPIINSAYRKMTGDTIAPAMKIVGGALFGGPIGAVASIISSNFESKSTAESTDPDSPYKDSNAIKSNVIAEQSSKAYLNVIEINDYATLEQTTNNKDKTKQPVLHGLDSWTLNSNFINRDSPIDESIKHQVSINASKKRQHFQYGDGIADLIYKNTENMTKSITSTNTPTETIDIVIGKTFNSG
ncbi:MAG: hypothetical protein AAF372_01625 [Pseudomonadota bacterium]